MQKHTNMFNAVLVHNPCTRHHFPHFNPSVLFLHFQRVALLLHIYINFSESNLCCLFAKLFTHTPIPMCNCPDLWPDFWYEKQALFILAVNTVFQPNYGCYFFCNDRKGDVISFCIFTWWMWYCSKRLGPKVYRCVWSVAKPAKNSRLIKQRFFFK